MRQLLFIGAVCALLAPASAMSQSLAFTQIAREFSGGLGFVNPSVRTAIAEDGRVAFVGDDGPGVERIFSGDGAALSEAATESAGYFAIRSLQINSSGDIPFVAVRTSSLGVYRTDPTGGAYSTLHEDPAPLPGTPGPAVTDTVSMSPNGNVTFSSIKNGVGALWRGTIDGSFSELRSGNGTFFNTRWPVVNDAGQVAVQMEHRDLATQQLRRGILIFDAPGQSLVEIDSVIDRLNVAFQPKPRINASGQIAFALNSDVSVPVFEPPNDGSGFVETIVIGAGVYVANATPFGHAFDLTLIADPSDGYTSFGELDINDAGTVVFEAGTPMGWGIFSGPDPAADKILQTGDEMDGRLFSVVMLGELNNAGQVSLLTSDYNTTDREVWRVDGVGQPPPSGVVDYLFGLLWSIWELIFGGFFS